MSNTPFLFLDFDGVCHADPDPDRPGEVEVFCCLSVLENALRGLDYRAVITSSWRSFYSVAEMHDMLGELGPKVVGVTTHLSHLPRIFNKGRCIRQAEILRWLEINREPDTPFLVLDDHYDSFEPAWPPLYLTDGKTGLRPEDAKAIRIRMERLQ